MFHQKKKNMMSKRHLLLIAVLAFVTVVAIWVARVTSLPDPSERLEAEKEIYSLLLAELISNEGIPLAASTTLGDMGYYVISQDDFIKWQKENPSLEQETFTNFVELNQQIYPIREYLPVEISDQMIGQQGWWVSFSRIGFNPHLNQALVVKQINMGCDSNGDCCLDQGSVIYLQKKDGRWKIEEQFNEWLGECAAQLKKDADLSAHWQSEFFAILRIFSPSGFVCSG